jgi:Xaa-Pro dipeptidase
MTGLGHSLGLDVHDVPSASKPDSNQSLQTKKLEGHESFYDNLRLRLVLEEGMVVVRAFPFTSSSCFNSAIHPDR